MKQDVQADKAQRLFLIAAALFVLTMLFTLWGFAQAPSPVVIDRYNGPGNKFDAARAMVVDAQGNVYITGPSESLKGNMDYVTIKYAAGGGGWVASYNGEGHGEDFANAIAVDNQGNVYVTGRSMGKNSDFDYATVGYDRNGNQIGVARYNGPSNLVDIAQDIKVDASGNVFVTGFTDGQNWLGGDAIATIKYALSNGGLQEQWVARYDMLLPNDGTATNKEVGTSLALDGSGNVYVTGASDGCVLIKYNDLATNYSEEWVRKPNGNQGRRVKIDNLGNVVVTGWGSFTGKYDAGGNLVWLNSYTNEHGFEAAFQDMVLDGEGNIYVTGYSDALNGKSDYTTVKYSAGGDLLWDALFNGTENDLDLARSITLDGNGNVFVTGYSSIVDGTKNGGTNYGTVKYDASTGCELWRSYYGGPENNGEAIVVGADGAGNVYVTGQSSGKRSYFDIATIKYTPTQESCSGAVTTRNNLAQETNGLLSAITLRCYPNPFRQSVAINFQVPEQDRVVVRVFDLLGREVATLVDETRPGGQHQVVFDAGGLPSGTYFCRMQFRNTVETRKLFLSR